MEKKLGLKENLLSDLLSGLLWWLAAAVLLILLGGALLARGAIAYSGMGYLCSAMSFAAALIAGIGIGRRGAGLLRAAVFALALVVLLLLLGYLLSDGQLSSSGILNVVSFTVSGCLLGVILSGLVKPHSGTKKGKKMNFKMKLHS